MFDFSSTHWSQVDLLGRRRPGAEDEAYAWEAAWEHLVRKYEPAFVVVVRQCLRRAGARVVGPDQAADIVQAFFAACLHKGWLERAAPEFGQFRAFAFTLLRRFTFKYVESAQAQKRYPVTGQISLDDVLPGRAPARLDESQRESLHEWVRCLVEASTERVRKRSPDNARVMDLVLREDGLSNAQLAELLGWPPNKFTLARHRGLRMLREEIRNEVSDTVRSSHALTAELEILAPFLGARVSAL